MFIRLLAIAVVIFAAGSAFAAPHTHVIVIGVDGMSPDGIHNADTPNMDRIMREGAYSFHARAVFPSSSSPNWASMIMGAGPEQHGVISNSWRIDDFVLAPTATGTDGFFPTIFDLLRRTYPDAVSAMFHDWGGFANLFAHEDLDEVYTGGGPSKVTNKAVDYFRKMQPHLLFIHLDHVDHAGHETGHGTPQYYAAVEEADEYIGRVLDAVASSPIADSTYVLVTADHGGRNKGHGGWTMEEMLIPWMIEGPGIRKGYELQAPINTYDTAATVAKILEVPPHPAWIARPVNEAFAE
jgi:predicted AlkP superfamily pyrophosphatase or phosphodiesterase